MFRKYDSSANFIFVFLDNVPISYERAVAAQISSFDAINEQHRSFEQFGFADGYFTLPIIAEIARVGLGPKICSLSNSLPCSWNCCKCACSIIFYGFLLGHIPISH